MADLLSLAKRMDTLNKRIPVAVNDLKKAVALKIGTDLIQVTPVDTSQALSNWQGNINTPTDVPLPAIVPGKKGDTESASEGEAIAHLERVLDDLKPGEPIYISNVLPYIVGLNDGTSKQEPAGFVERALVLGRVALRDTRLKLGG